jgi:predicted RNA methylase
MSTPATPPKPAGAIRLESELEQAEADVSKARRRVVDIKCRMKNLTSPPFGLVKDSAATAAEDQ